jgi:hypothetical protein
VSASLQPRNLGIQPYNREGRLAFEARALLDNAVFAYQVACTRFPHRW